MQKVCNKDICWKKRLLLILPRNPQALRRLTTFPFICFNQRASVKPALIPHFELPAGMAIYPKVNAYTRDNPPQPINIEAWTEQAAQSLNAISLSDRGTSVSLAIALDEKPARGHADDDARPVYRPRRESLRRDSLKRREALLKGKEGSRRRQRWENGSFTFFHSSQMTLCTG